MYIIADLICFLKTLSFIISSIFYPHKKKTGIVTLLPYNPIQSYNASLLPYGTNIGAPSVIATGVSTWVNTNVSSFNHSFKNKIELIKEDYQELIDEYEVNDMLYKAKMNFEPIIGKEYYLYFSDKKGENFLSIIPPHTWKMEFIGAFVLNADKIWKRIKND